MNLAHKRVLITAAAQGIGRASVLALRDAGAQVIATDLHIEALQDIPGIQALALDVTRAADIDAAASAPNLPAPTLGLTPTMSASRAAVESTRFAPPPMTSGGPPACTGLGMPFISVIV